MELEYLTGVLVRKIHYYLF